MPPERATRSERRRHATGLDRRPARRSAEKSGPGRRVDCAPPGHNLPARRESETRALHPRGYAAISLPQAPSVRLPSLGRTHRFAGRRWPGVAPDDYRAKSGEPRTCALIYLKDGERLVVVASNGGSDHPPSWLLNLQADPDVGVQIGRKKFSARASVASAEERERLWPRVNRHNMGLAPIMHPSARGRYDVYQRHTTREIPLVLLERSTQEARSPAGADATNSTA